MTPLAPHLAVFFRERLPLERGASPLTCDSYATAFKLFLVFAAKRLKVTPSQLHLEQLDAPLVLAFLSYLETNRGNGTKTRNLRLAAIKSFMRFLEHRVPAALDQVRRVLAIPSKKAQSRLVAFLRRDEMQALLDAPAPTSRAGVRDRAMLHVAFAAGLRVSELIGLRVEEVELHPTPSVRIRGKGRRERWLPLWKETGVAIRAWLAIRGDVSAPELFLNSRGQPMTRSGFEYILDKYVDVAAAKSPSLRKKAISPHVLRHTCAMTLLQATHDIRKVSLWLGHASTQTTEVYTRADPNEKLDAIASVIPPSLRRGRFHVPDQLLAMLSQARHHQHYAE